MLVIRKPEITKKTSTPMKPPGRAFGKAWKFITSITAMARRPSISGRYFGEGENNGALTRDHDGRRTPTGCRAAFLWQVRVVAPFPVVPTAKNALVGSTESAVESRFSKPPESALGDLEKG